MDGMPSGPIPPEGLRGESVKGRLPNDGPMPPDMPDTPLPIPIGPMVNEGRFPLIIADGRGLKASDPPPDIRAGVIAPNRPANGTIDPEPIDELDAPAIAP